MPRSRNESKYAGGWITSLASKKGASSSAPFLITRTRPLAFSVKNSRPSGANPSAVGASSPEAICTSWKSVHDVRQRVCGGKQAGDRSDERQRICKFEKLRRARLDWSIRNSSCVRAAGCQGAPQRRRSSARRPEARTERRVKLRRAARESGSGRPTRWRARRPSAARTRRVRSARAASRGRPARSSSATGRRPGARTGR